MPAYVTHSLFGRDVLASAPNQEIQQLIQQRPVPFEWGLQGPDLLFFNGTLDVMRDHTLNRLGGLIHREQTAALFHWLCEYLLSIKRAQGYENTLSYALGFCCHYSLDSVAHPFIYYMQEKLKKTLPERWHRGVHNKLESDIDSEICRMKTGKAVRNFHVDRALVTDAGAKRDIARMYQQMLSAVYCREASTGALEHCFDEGYRVLRLVLDKPFVLQLACVLDFLAGKRNALAAHVRRSRAEDDVLNLAHRSWWNLSDPDTECAASYPELERQALERAVQMQSTLWESLCRDEAAQYAGLASFDNGSPK